MTMMIMPANNTGAWVGYLAGRYEGAIGHLYSPGAECGPFPFLPYALDNGAFGAFINKRPFDVAAWRALLGWAQSCGQRPMWSLVPDVVGDKEGTLAAWKAHAGEVAICGFKPAFAVQDGMLPEDVPSDAEVIFVGGSTEWKWSTAAMWCDAFPHVHIGRVNTLRWLRVASKHGAKSVDGTGWFRGDKNQREGLRHFLAEQAGEVPTMAQQTIFGALP
jgi:hypothetical protein